MIRSFMLFTVLAFLFVLSAPSFAGDVDSTPKPETLIIPKGKVVRFRMKTKKFIMRVVSTEEKVLEIGPAPGDPGLIFLLGAAPGVTSLTLTDLDGTEEHYSVVVKNP